MFARYGAINARLLKQIAIDTICWTNEKWSMQIERDTQRKVVFIEIVNKAYTKITKQKQKQRARSTQRCVNLKAGFLNTNTCYFIWVVVDIAFFFSRLPHTLALHLSHSLPLTHNMHKHKHLDFNQFRIVLCALCVFSSVAFVFIWMCMFLLTNFICSSPFSSYLFHSISCCLSLYILALYNVLLHICANPMELALFGITLFEWNKLAKKMMFWE